MQPFSIEYITGNIGPSSYTQQENTDDVHNVYNTSLHLEDVYSVISQDTSLNSLSSTLPPSNTPIDVETYCSTTSPDDVNPSSNYEYTITSPPFTEHTIERQTSKPQYTNHSTERVTPPLQYTDVRHARATPSPNRDSGIESDNSPSSSQTDEYTSKTLRTLDQKAENISRSKPTSKSSSASDKPSHSYVALIAMAILDSRDRKLALCDIYRHIMESHSFYNNEEKSWRNSIRYNLSINECFIKCGKDETGKGNFWCIHPLCVEDFAKGDYRRRQARRRARRGMKVVSDVVPTAPTPSNAYVTMTPSFTHGYHPYGQQLTNQYSPYGIPHVGQQQHTLPAQYTATPLNYMSSAQPNMYTYPYTSYPGYMAHVLDQQTTAIKDELLKTEGPVSSDVKPRNNDSFKHLGYPTQNSTKHYRATADEDNPNAITIL